MISFVVREEIQNYEKIVAYNCRQKCWLAILKKVLGHQWRVLSDARCLNGLIVRWTPVKSARVLVPASGIMRCVLGQDTLLWFSPPLYK